MTNTIRNSNSPADQELRRRFDLLSPTEASTYTRKSGSALAKLRVYGCGPTYLKVGRRVFYDIADLDIWLASRRRHNTSEIVE